MKIETKLLKLIKRAIPKAILDRESLYLAYNGCDCEDILTQIKEFKSQQGLKFEELNASIVMSILLYAEQYEMGYIESIENCSDLIKEYKQGLKEAKEYRVIRHQIFGKTELEKHLESGTSIPIHELTSKNDTI